MKKIRKINIKLFVSFRGKLIPIVFNKKFTFSIERIFFLYDKKIKTKGLDLKKEFLKNDDKWFSHVSL